MALARVFFKVKAARAISFRGLSTTSLEKVEKSVFISQSKDVFSNLALEDWMYKNWDFSKNHVMLLWRNEPCVVIGRHQNPWAEADPELLEANGIQLARRNSGGGAVYHDKGNLNITFFTPREKYNRNENLELIVSTLRDNWGLDVGINDRHDILLNSLYKISQVSGTASKLGRPNAYHHCTLLVDVNKTTLSSSLNHFKGGELNTNATKSVRSNIVNLKEVASNEGRKNLDMEGLMTALGWAYLASCPITNVYLGWKQISKSRGFQLVSPTEDWFQGLGALKDELSSWEWVWGKTPKFEVKREVGGGLIVCVEVENGLINSVGLEGLGGGKLVRVVSSLHGQRFSSSLLSALLEQVSRQVPAILAGSAQTISAAAARA